MNGFVIVNLWLGVVNLVLFFKTENKVNLMVACFNIFAAVICYNRGV